MAELVGVGALSEDAQRAYAAWVARCPEVVQRIIATHPANCLYRLKTTGQRVTILAYNEDGTVRVGVGGKFNFVFLEREVYGIDPADLEECDLPGPDEPLGCLAMEMGLSPEQAVVLVRAAMVKRGHKCGHTPGSKQCYFCGKDLEEPA